MDGGVGCGGEALAVHVVPRNQSIPGTTTKSMRTVLGRNMTLVYVLTTQYPQFTIQAINRHASGKKKLYLFSLLI